MLLVLRAFQALKSHTDQKGFVRYATISQLMPTSTAAVCKVKTKHFSQPQLFFVDRSNLFFS